MDQIKRVGMVALAACIAAAAPGCVEERPPLRVGAIEVTGEFDGVFDNLELEVHAFDADVGTFLGCAKLSKVDATDTRYSMKQAFVRSAGEPGHRELLRDADLVGRSLVFVVAELDEGDGLGNTSSGGCPLPYDLNDEIVGVSSVISEESVMTGVSLSFDRVAFLSVGVDL